MRPAVVVELCCGSAALSLRLWDADPPMPYMGSKARYARAILDLVGVDSRPARVVLVDAGPWAEAWRLLMGPKRADVVEAVRALVTAGEDPRAMWERLRTSPPPAEVVQRVAVWLVLQRASYRGKMVDAKPNGWSDTGLSKVNAYGCPGTESFGEVAPQLPGLPDRLAALPMLPAEVHHGSALDLAPPADASGWLVYLDPPYAGTTGYGAHDLTRDDVAALALRWRRAGAVVVVSEAEPLPLSGWHHVEITGERTGKVSSWQRREWLTMTCAPAQAGLFAGVP